MPKGEVISQDPDGDGSEYVDPGTTVDIVVSAGKPDVMLRSVLGLQEGRGADPARERRVHGRAQEA